MAGGEGEVRGYLHAAKGAFVPVTTVACVDVAPMVRYVQKRMAITINNNNNGSSKHQRWNQRMVITLAIFPLLAVQMRSLHLELRNMHPRALGLQVLLLNCQSQAHALQVLNMTWNVSQSEGV